MKQKNNLTEGNITKHLIALTIPMVAGMMVMQGFNIADTYFVAKLGAIELAAISYTGPVVMLIWAIAMGIGLGLSSTVSKAVGESNHEEVKQLTTNGLRMTFVAIATIAATGILTVEQTFKLLGADPELIPMIASYMLVWYCFTPLMILPMVANSAIRATGDSLRPAIIMSIGAILNILFDPILIFGLWGFPKLGITGAAIATVTSRLFTVVASFMIMHYHFKMLEFSKQTIAHALHYWKIIIKYAIPAILTNTLLPVMSFIIMRLVSIYGYKAVAGTGAGQKIQFFIYSIPIAIGSITVPIIGQNFGAKRIDRISEAWKKITKFDISYSLITFIIIIFAGEHIASQFSKDPEIIRTTCIYLYICIFASGLQHVVVHSGFVMNGLGHPKNAAVLNVVRLLGLIIPLAIIGQKLYGYIGIYSGVALGQITSGIIGYIWVVKMIKKTKVKQEPLNDEYTN
ncbi:MAG: MATE family efflux transporter [Kiritimatiellae bacterium]|jgi:putative MATE family efflux protein|nr:MATE family efflux transporter [Kiritimatiellia bacterium]